MLLGPSEAQGQDLMWRAPPAPPPERPLRPEVVLHWGCLAPASFQSGLMAETEEHSLCVLSGPWQVTPCGEQTKQVAWGLPMGDTGPPTVKPLQPPDEDGATQDRGHGTADVHGGWSPSPTAPETKAQ